MSLRNFQDKTPQLGERVFVDPHSCVIGEVTLGKDVSLWPMAVLRGDVNFIEIGEGSNFQDNSTGHVSHKTPENPEGFSLKIGIFVTVGHQVMLHGCTIGDFVSLALAVSF